MPGATVLSLIVFLALTAAAAATGIQFRPGEWYETLVKPDWTPPNWLFPPVWTVLYIMIAVAGWRVWLAQGLGRATIVWAIALLLNAVGPTSCLASIRSPSPRSISSPCGWLLWRLSSWPAA